jgi:hypothetical protein
MEETVGGHVRWDVNFRSGDYVEEFGTESVVFLAAESPNVLTGNGNTYCSSGLRNPCHYRPSSG